MKRNELRELETLQGVVQQLFTSIMCYNPREFLFQIQTRLYETHTAEGGIINRYIDAISRGIQVPYMTSKAICWDNSVIDYEILSFGGVQTCCVTDDRTNFITATQNVHGMFEIVVSNIKTGFLEKRIRGNLSSSSDEIKCIAVSTGSKWIICGSEKGNVQVYDFNSEQCLQKLRTSTGIKGLCVNEVGTTVVIRCPDEVIIWNLATNTTFSVQQSFTGDVHFINNDTKIFCGASNELKVLNIEDGTLVDEVHLDHEVNHIKAVANSSTRDRSSSDTELIGNFCVATNGKSPGFLSVLNMDTLSVVSRMNTDHSIRAVSTPRYGRVALGLSTGEISVWDLYSGEYTGTYSVGYPKHSWGSIHLVEFLQEGQLISRCRDGYTYVWSLNAVDKQQFQDEETVQPIKGLTVSADELFLATRADSGSISVWDAKTCCESFSVAVSHFCTGWKWSMSFSSANQFVGYCNLGISVQSKKVQAYLGLIDIQKRKVAAENSVNAEVHLNSDNYSIDNVELKFVETHHLVLGYKLDDKQTDCNSSFEYKAFKIVSAGNSISLQPVDCKSVWKSMFNTPKDTSREDKIYYKDRFVFMVNEIGPDTILATLPYHREPGCPTYYNEESGTFITAMVNDEIVSLKFQK